MVGAPPRVVIVVVRHPPRVTVAVPTRGSALSSSHCRGANPSSSHYRGSTSSSSHYRGANPWVQQTGLVCPTHTPVTIVVQTVVSIQRIRSLIVVSIQRIRSLIESLSWCQPLLESLSRCQLGVRHSRWQMVVCVSLHTVRIRVSGWGVEPGEK